MSPPSSQPSTEGTRLDHTAGFAAARPGTSVGQVFAFVAGFVALAAIGAAIGWSLTKTSHPVVAGSTSPSTPVSVSPSGPPSSPPPSPIASGSFAIPNFSATGTDFITARTDLIAMKVGVRLIFDSRGTTPNVQRTDPTAGTVVTKGITVKVYVNEAPPLLAVPNVISQDCATAGKTIAAAGLFPQYATGKTGTVAAELPAPNDPTVHWNDTIALTCTADGTLPSASPPPPTPSASESGDQSPGGTNG